jgi:D-tyrosyl-tRNA(Tyr) deacylase
MSKYAVPSVDAETVKHCVQRTMEKVESAVFDWKSMRASDRQKVISALEQLNIPVERT